MEKIDLENFPLSKSAKKMLGYVSDGFYDKSYVGKWLFQVMGMEYDEVLEMMETLPEQFFPETATWGLMYHEIKWGLPVRQNLSYEERRRLICQKRDYRAPMTPYRMEKYLEDAIGLDVHIADINDPGEYGFIPPHPNVFKVTSFVEGTLDAEAVRGIIDRLKQSHTIYVLSDRIAILAVHCGMERFIIPELCLHMSSSFFHKYGQDGAPMLESHTKHLYRGYTVENTEKAGASIVMKKNLWHLDGAVRLDGSRKLNAKTTKEVL